MKSQIDDKLTEQERKIFRVYRDPKSSGLGRQLRLSIQYAIGAGIFLGLAIWFEQPLYAVVVYVVLILWMLIRLIGSQAITGVMPRILEKYESEIKELKTNSGANSTLEGTEDSGSDPQG